MKLSELAPAINQAKQSPLNPRIARSASKVYSWYGSFQKVGTKQYRCSIYSIKYLKIKVRLILARRSNKTRINPSNWNKHSDTESYSLNLVHSSGQSVTDQLKCHSFLSPLKKTPSSHQSPQFCQLPPCHGQTITKKNHHLLLLFLSSPFSWGPCPVPRWRNRRHRWPSPQRPTPCSSSSSSMYRRRWRRMAV